MGSWLGISLGDVTGVGPEVTLKAIANDLAADDSRYLIFGDITVLEQLSRRLNLGLTLEPYTGPGSTGRICVDAGGAPKLPDSLPAGAPQASGAAICWLRAGARACLEGLTSALVTAPVSKEAIIRSGQPFVGQTEFLSHLAGTRRTIMMLLGPDERGRWLRVALATTHLPLREVAGALTTEKVHLAIVRAAQACHDLHLSAARVAVCGLNPHAGEGGKLGDEEQTIIGPAVEVARREGYVVVGPLPADTLFHQAFRGDFQAVVAMYHDQGLGPLKMIAFDAGVNWTLGLPFIRTSPDHGTAYDIAGTDKANPSSMRAAIALAKQLARRAT